MREVFELAPASAKPIWFLGGIVVLLIALAVLFIYFVIVSRTMTVMVTSEALRINGGLYGRTIPIDRLVLDGARQVDLTAERDFRPRVRTNGLGAPGYQAGWFKLRNGEKALVFLTDRERVVYVPTRLGYGLLLSMERPEAFLEALRPGS